MRSSHPPLNSLATRWAACKGQVPPPLVGASIALIDHDYNATPRPGPSRAATAPGAQIFLFGGRLVSSRQMINDLYILDLDTREWRKVPFEGDFDAEGNRLKPLARYFHSCEVWNDKLVFFGGMGVVAASPSSPDMEDNDDKSDGLSVLDEVVVLDLRTLTWEFDFLRDDQDHVEASPTRPNPRYAHLSSITGDSMIIIGGQNMANKYVEEINVLDLKQRKWVLTQTFPRQCGSYRSLAVSSPFVVEGESTTQELADAISGSGRTRASSKSSSATTSSSIYPHTPAANGTSASQPHSLPALHPLPMSRPPRQDESSRPIYIYSNYNFTDVKRELEVATLQSQSIALEDRSGEMAGATLPPGLRFPTGMVAGDNLLVAGTYLANTSQTFSVWTLALDQMTWTRLDAGPLLGKGSWNRAIMWPSSNRMVILGNRERDLVTDYNHRQTNWDHLLLLDLEAWGIGQPPQRPMTDQGLEFGLRKLETAMVTSISRGSPVSGRSALSHGFVDSQSWLRQYQPSAGKPASATSLPTLPSSLGSPGDFEIVCADGVRIGCDRIVLERRWPWFAHRQANFKRQARSAAEVMRARNPHGTIDSTWGFLSSSRNGRQHATNGGGANSAPGSAARTPTTPSFPAGSNTNGADDGVEKYLTDCRFLPRELHIPEPSPVVLALLQFFYTRCICTSLQRHPAIVASMLILSKVYKMEDTLGVWARHAAGISLGGDLLSSSLKAGGGGETSTAVALSPTSVTQTSTIPLEECHRLAVVIYEAAGLAEYEPLQLRALRTVVLLSKALQQRNDNGTPTLRQSQQQPQSAPPQQDVLSPSTSLSSIVTGTPARRPSEPIRMATSSSIPLATQDATSPNRPPSPTRAARPVSTISPSSGATMDVQSAKLERLLGLSANRAQPQRMPEGGLPTPSLGEPSPYGGLTGELGPVGERRPSPGAPQYHSSSSSYTSSGLSRPAPASAPLVGNPTPRSNNTTGGGGRKRFSLFGRSNNDATPPASANQNGSDPNYNRWGLGNGHQYSDGVTDTIEEETSRLSMGTASSGSTVGAVAKSSGAPAPTPAWKSPSIGSTGSGSGGGGASSTFTAANPAATSLSTWSPMVDGLEGGPVSAGGGGGGRKGSSGASAVTPASATPATTPPPAFFLF